MEFKEKPLELLKEIPSYLGTLDFEKFYKVTIEEVRSKRSLEQNKLLWKMIHEIAKKTQQDDNDVYCALLEEADAKSDYVITAFEMETALRKSFRGVKFIKMQEVNDKDCYVYKVYIGSSKMNVKEMNELLDTVQRIAGKLGIYLEERF